MAVERAVGLRRMACGQRGPRAQIAQKYGEGFDAYLENHGSVARPDLQGAFGKFEMLECAARS